MDLISYALEKGGTGTLLCPVFARVAADADCSAGTLYMIAKGHKLAGPKLAGRIAEATEQEVTRLDLRPDVFGEAGENDPARQPEAANDAVAAGPQTPPLKAA